MTTGKNIAYSNLAFGLSTTESKAMQAEVICRDGDIEDLDIVANYGWIRSGRLTAPRCYAREG